MDGGLLDVLGDARDERLPVLEVGVKVGPVHDGRRLRLDARLLVRQRQLVQHVHVGQRVRERHLLGHPGVYCAAGRSRFCLEVPRTPSKGQKSPLTSLVL